MPKSRRMKAARTPAPTVLNQSVPVQRNPLTPQTIEPRPTIQVVTRADLRREYVPAGINGYLPFLRAQPTYTDEVSQAFGIEVWEKMMTDPDVYSSVNVFILGVLANGYEIVPSLTEEDDDYGVAVEMADFVRENLANLKTPYLTILRQHLTAFQYGCSISEQRYILNQTAKPPVAKFAQSGTLLYYLDDIREKPHRNAIFVVDSYNNTVGMLTQRFPGQVYAAGTYIPIDPRVFEGTRGGESDVNHISEPIPGFLPRSLFSILTNDMRYNDERGRSGLRAAYQAWWFKQQIVAEYLSYLSKFGSPSIIANTPPQSVPETQVDANMNVVLGADGLPITVNPAQALADAIAGFENGTGLVMPADAKAEVYQPNDTQGFTRALAWCSKQISQAITSQFLATNEGEHQSRASSETHQDILSLGFNATKRNLAVQQRRDVYKPLLMYNFDLTGKKIDRYVPHLNLGYGNGFPFTAATLSTIAGKYPIDPSQYGKIDEMIGLPPRQTITVRGQAGMADGLKLTPSQMQERMDAEAQAKREDAMQKQKEKGDVNKEGD